MVACAEAPALPADHRQGREGAWEGKRRSGGTAGIRSSGRSQGEAAGKAFISAVWSSTVCPLFLVWFTFWWIHPAVCPLHRRQHLRVPCATVCTALRSLDSCSRINQNFLFSQSYKRSVAIFKNDLSLKFLSSFPLPHLHLPSCHFSFLALPQHFFLQRWSNPAPTENTNGVE